MKLPNSKQAIVPEKKLVGYLLSETHAVGRFKARFFRRFGFNQTNIAFLHREIINLAQGQDVKNVETSEFGTKYIVEGTISTPVGKGVKIRAIWIIEKDGINPVFVTAYPV